MTDQTSTQLAALLCSRLCHDMLSPVGALSNGLELLADEHDPEMRQRCLELLEQSAKISADKLKFFRLAYGAAGGFGESVPVEEPQSVVNALVSDAKRIEANWSISSPSLPKGAVKVMLNFAHMAIEALVRGGTLDIGAELNDGTSEIVVRATGPKIAFDSTVGDALDGSMPLDKLTGRTAPAHMLAMIAQSSGGQVQYHLTDDALVLGAVLPAA